MAVGALFPEAFRHLMAFGFIDDRLQQTGPDIIIRAAAAQHALEIGFPVVEQAGAQPPLRGQAQPVAPVTEVMADRADKTKGADRILAQPKHPGRAVGLLPL